MVQFSEVIDRGLAVPGPDVDLNSCYNFFQERIALPQTGWRVALRRRVSGRPARTEQVCTRLDLPESQDLAPGHSVASDPGTESPSAPNFAVRGRRGVAKVGDDEVPLEFLETHEIARYVGRRGKAFANRLSSKDTALGEPDIRNRLRRPQNDETQEDQPERQGSGDAGMGMMYDSRTLYADVDNKDFRP